MGWNSWNRFRCRINEKLIRKQADALVSTGLSKLGYVYVNVDDCWQASRDSDGNIIEDFKAFPSGIKALSDYVHSKGLKFGLYSSAGTQTCEGRPGGLNHELQDARKYSEWKIDYFKYDNCMHEGRGDKTATKSRYGALRDALNATGRPINYALCSWGEVNVWEFGKELGNSWRTTLDIQDSWKSILSIINQNENLHKYAAPGGFNDMDMLEVGNGRMTQEEYRTHFSVWAALKSPLLLGHDLTKTTRKTLEIIGNKRVIAINQDPLGRSAILRIKYRNVFVWVGELVDGDRVLLVMNGGHKTVEVSIDMAIFAVSEKDVRESETYLLETKDLWENNEGTSVATWRNSIVAGRIPYHSVKMYRVSRKNGKFPSLQKAGRILEDIPITVVEYFSFVGYCSSFHRAVLILLPMGTTAGLLLSFAHHPDRTIDLPEEAKIESNQKYVTIQQAYELLKDDKYRREYDQFGSFYTPSPNKSSDTRAYGSAKWDWSVQDPGTRELD
ncbi:glycoside hydrolase [Rhizoclosmatium globosum]|uniref:Alpha-galactosidase n=1 Tax=Rhizoclosmatium globosum TaxID=329046 RepID=A0A1Y2BXX4_9FUNG|nr:glycoside hydrolase [Rhizoclosmatium globosum]|eukprot:ORY39622.1 glycoside hydrolase [Rhizoclosmatium globosum]